MLHSRFARNLTACLLLICVTPNKPDDQLIANTQDSDLEIARQCANWLDSVSIIDAGRRYWPTVPKVGKTTSKNMYSGNPGVILFFLELHAATGERKYLQTAIEGGDWLREHAMDFASKPDPAFFTGTSGVGFVFDQLHSASKLSRFKIAGQSCYSYLLTSSKEVELAGRKTVQWNDVTDIVGGTAGIGFYLLESRRFDDRAQALETAIMAGDNLLAHAKPVELSGKGTGLKWMMSPTFPREMPNYSHGTAGICDFLLALDQACRAAKKMSDQYDGRFLQAAQQGANYLEMLSAKSGKSQLIPHHFPDGDQLYYLGWCHGPPGTVRFLDRLSNRTQDKRWAILAKELTRSMFRSGIPKSRPEGFWNNAGLCCGNAGVASFLLDVEPGSGKQAKELAEDLTRDIVERGTREKMPNGEPGLYWTHAEHRVRPELLQAQTGLMQGTAGIGMYFVRRHQWSQGKDLVSDLPMMPY